MSGRSSIGQTPTSITLRPGDHICSVYDTDDQLVETVAYFLNEGLTRGERCWYVPAGAEAGAIRAAMDRLGVDVAAESTRSALHLLDSNDTYTVRGGFDPEQTMRVFSEAIEQALTDGFKGFRAAAEMSWALEIDDGAEAVSRTNRCCGCCSRLRRPPACASTTDGGCPLFSSTAPF